MCLELYKLFDKLVKEETEKAEELDKIISIAGKKEIVLSSGLKIRHKESGLLYTVVLVSADDVVLKTPEGEKFLIDTDTLENEYELG